MDKSITINLKKYYEESIIIPEDEYKILQKIASDNNENVTSTIRHIVSQQLALSGYLNPAF